MKTVGKLIRYILIGWGIVCLLGVICTLAFIVYSIGPGNSDKHGEATKKDVRFVLNWCELGDERIEKVVNSFVSARSFTGDYVEAYAIQISGVSSDELVSYQPRRSWVRCDLATGLHQDAIEYVKMWIGTNGLEWFPSRQLIESDEFFVYIWSIYYHRTTATGAEVILIHPKSNMIYYLGAKM